MTPPHGPLPRSSVYRRIRDADFAAAPSRMTSDLCLLDSPRAFTPPEGKDHRSSRLFGLYADLLREVRSITRRGIQTLAPGAGVAAPGGWGVRCW